MRVVALLVALAACRQNAPSPEPQRAPDPPAAPTKIPAERHTLELPGDGNGLVWDGGTLYVTDDTHNRIAAWQRGTAFVPAGSFPAADRVGLSALVRLPDGRLVAPSFGFGTQGAVFIAGPDGGTAVPNLDPKRRRIGLARSPEGALYVGYFVVAPGSKHSGGVARLDLATGETDLITQNLGKPVGLVATDTTLYVADQDRLAILAFTLPDPGPPTVIAQGLGGVDHLTRLPNGDLVTGGKKGELYRIALDGRVSTIASGYEHVRGTAYDGPGRRLFVVEHSAASSRHKLHILPIE